MKSLRAITAGVLFGASAISGCIVQKSDGAICVIVNQRETYGLGCGEMSDVAAGRVALRLQFADRDPAVFVGVGSNDITAAEVAGEKTGITANIWLKVADPSQHSFRLVGDGKSLAVDTGGDQPATESPRSSQALRSNSDRRPRTR